MNRFITLIAGLTFGLIAFLVVFAFRMLVRLLRLAHPGAFARQTTAPQRAHVVDGDTVHLADGTKVRLLGIDAPELNQPGGDDARSYLIHLIGKSRVVLETFDTDRYGRVVARVLTEEGHDLCGEMVAHGYAHAYTRYCTDYKSLERKAKRANLGLWGKGLLRQTPSEWRKRNY